MQFVRVLVQPLSTISFMLIIRAASEFHLQHASLIRLIVRYDKPMQLPLEKCLQNAAKRLLKQVITL